MPLTVVEVFSFGLAAECLHRPPMEWEVLAVEGQVLPTGAWQHPAHTNAKQLYMIYLLSL